MTLGLDALTPRSKQARSRTAASALSPAQVIDLATTKPEDALRRFAAVDGLRVLVCGGGAACSQCPSLPEPA